MANTNKVSNDICIGVFIHNEEYNIKHLLSELAKQSIFQNETVNVDVYLLFNGCIDSSIQASSKLAKQYGFITIDWSEGGKARTWNRFVHTLIADNVKTIIFIDGDIRLPEPHTIARLVTTLDLDSCCITTSKPVKNISIYKRWNPLRFFASVIKSPHKDGSICGQLYAMKNTIARNVWLPDTCLVEDGFLAAVVVTNSFQASPEINRVKAVSEAWHCFDPPRNLDEFFQHDVRLAVGTELNAALFTQLWNTTNLFESRQLLKEFSKGNKIDSSIVEHLKMPQNHALQYKRILRYSWPKGQNLTKGLTLFPIRFVHMLYMYVVFKIAQRHFACSKFKW